MNEKKLFVCSVNVGLMVWAEDKETAAAIAAASIEEEIGNGTINETDFIVSNAYTGRHRVFAEGWDKDDLPFGLDDDEEDLTVDDCFKELERKGYTP